MNDLPSTTQVLVIGGGPGGSTAATLLARQGFDVTLLERAHFPRYHIGESLLPTILPILDLLGAREKIEAFGHQRKPGAFLQWGNEQWSLDFGELSGNTTYALRSSLGVRPDCSNTPSPGSSCSSRSG
jgi:2-polyprenyl-6-methoxyphenol hydroxylase-like FAD-dependent oxidoreductase